MMEIAEEPDGSGLLNKIDSFHPKIVFMDIRLPGENGLELTKKIKKNYPDIIIVILTSYDLPEYRQSWPGQQGRLFCHEGFTHPGLPCLG